MEYTVTATTTELTRDTRWVFLDKGRLQLSPTPVSISLPRDAHQALALAMDFYALVPAGHGVLLTIDGPLGLHHSHYSGPKGHGMEDALIKAQATAVRTAV